MQPGSRCVGGFGGAAKRSPQGLSMPIRSRSVSSRLVQACKRSALTMLLALLVMATITPSQALAAPDAQPIVHAMDGQGDSPLVP